MTQPTLDASSRDWQTLDRRHHLHPFVDPQSLEEKGTRVIVGAEGCRLDGCSSQVVLGLFCAKEDTGNRCFEPAIFGACKDSAFLECYLWRIRALYDEAAPELIFELVKAN